MTTDSPRLPSAPAAVGRIFQIILSIGGVLIALSGLVCAYMMYQQTVASQEQTAAMVEQSEVLKQSLAQSETNNKLLSEQNVKRQASTAAAREQILYEENARTLVRRTQLRALLFDYIPSKDCVAPPRVDRRKPTCPWRSSEAVRRDAAASLLDLETAHNEAREPKTDLRFDFEGASIPAAHLDGRDLHSATFYKADLRRVSLAKAILNKADLRHSNLAGASLESAVLTGARLQNSALVGANLRSANFELCNLDGASLNGADLKGASFKGASLVGAMLGGANLQDTDFEGANLSGADLINLRVKLDGVPDPEGTTATYKSGWRDPPEQLKIAGATCDRATRLPWGHKCSKEGVIEGPG